MLSACESEPVTPETPREASPEPISETHVATVSSSGRELAAFVVAVVGDGPGKTAGLSAFAPLGESQGLVLAWDDPTRVCIWNQPVDYPIDVAYVDRERRIVAVEQFEARDTRSRCHDEVVDVLETQLNRLSAARIGDRVVLEPMP